MSHVKAVKVKQVIIVESVIGTGADNDPIRPITQIFDLDGTEIATGDYTKEAIQ